MTGAVDDSGRWRKLVACLVGGVVAGFVAPVICAVGGGILAATVGAGVICSTVTTLADNAMRPRIEEVRYHPAAAQRLFRSAVSQFLSTHFDPIIETIRRNKAAEYGPLKFSVSLNQASRVMQFAYTDEAAILIEYTFRIRPQPGTPERDIQNSRPPRNLPNHTNFEDHVRYALPDDLRNANQSLFDGMGWALMRGAAVGAAGGLCLPLAPGWYFLNTAPGVAGIVYGIPTVAGSASSVLELINDDPTPYERIAYSIHFGSEIGLNVNRVIQCANDNGVEIEYSIKAGMGKKACFGGSSDEANPGRGADWFQVWYENRSHLFA